MDRYILQVFLKCLKKNNQDHFPCKELSKAYLECRMEKQLMAKEDLNNLGFDKDGQYKRAPAVTDKSPRKEEEGFIAGLGVRASKSWWTWGQ